MKSVLEKRVSLHRCLAEQRRENDLLKLQLTNLQALANMGTAMCMIAHEINNLLTPLAGYAQLALKHPEDTALSRKALVKTAGNCAHARKVLESVVALANGEAQEKKTCELKSLIDEIFACLCRDFSKDRIRLSVNVPDGLTVRAVPMQIQQVLMNLILNAREAMLGKGGFLTIQAHETDGSVCVEVIDTGCGVDTANLRMIFEPFFTTKAEKNGCQRTGAGLGLSFCKEIIDAHNGTISVESERGKGTKFRITLPKK